MGPLLRLSLRQLAGRRRILIILLLAALPVALAAVISAVADDNETYAGHFIDSLLDGMMVAAIMPIVTMAMATATFGDEVSDRTLSYLVLKPVPRWLIVLPKMLAAVMVAGLLIIVSGVAAAILGLQGSFQAVLAVGVALFAGVVAYSAIFTWAGLVTTRALGFALIYVFLWEGLISSFLGGVRYLSVRSYTLAIMHGIDGEGFEVLESRVIEFPAAVVGAVAVTAVFFWLAVCRLRRMDVP
ncbi:MAG: ABC transporter permease [Dehalococcoidia bacterium]